MSDLANYDWSLFTAAGIVDRVEYFPALTSTNDYAREKAASLPPGERLLVVADDQTAGRGRGSNRWWTGAGSLACSLLFNPAALTIERRYYPMISLAAAIAIVETTLAATGRSDVGLHWPNDVFAAGRKLAGVLVEALADGRHVLGIGCNVHNRRALAPPELASIVTSLVDLSDVVPRRGDVLLNILRRLDACLQMLAAEPEQLGHRANEFCLQHGSRLTLQAGARQVSGVCAGIAPDGALMLDTFGGRESFYSGVLVKSFF